ARIHGVFPAGVRAYHPHLPDRRGDRARARLYRRDRQDRRHAEQVDEDPRLSLQHLYDGRPGTPVAVQLFLMVFVILAIPGVKPAAIILTFGINSGAYVSENIRAGILSV